eukprot:COSAG06_NODE_1756_length_8453_cov_2.365159_2_plen_547_part_00
MAMRLCGCAYNAPLLVQEKMEELKKREAERDGSMANDTGGYSMGRLLGLISLDTQSTWEHALKANRETHTRAVILATGRVLWHLLQPAVCITLWFVSGTDTSWLQNVLVMGMVVHKAFDCVAIVICICVAPQFLRVHVMASHSSQTSLRAALKARNDSATQALKKRVTASDYRNDYNDRLVARRLRRDIAIFSGQCFVAMFLLASDKLVSVAVLKQLKVSKRRGRAPAAEHHGAGATAAATVQTRVGETFKSVRKAPIRTGFSLTSPKFGTLEKNVQVKVLEVKLVGAVERVRFDNGPKCKGWVSRKTADGIEVLMEIEAGPDRKRQLIELLMIVATCASPWLELCSIAALGLALGAGVSGTADDHALPSAVAVAHCLPATSLCCTITALAKHGDKGQGTQDKLREGFMVMVFVAMLTICLAFPQTVWLVLIGFLFLGLTAATGYRLLDDTGAGDSRPAAPITINDPKAHNVGCFCLAVCILCGLIGAGIMFKADGSDAQCTAYYDGFSYRDCNTLDPTGVGAHAENGSSNASVRVANASNCTLGG